MCSRWSKSVQKKSLGVLTNFLKYETVITGGYMLLKLIQIFDYPDAEQRSNYTFSKS